MGRTRLVLALAFGLSSVPRVASLQGQSIREVFDRVSHAVVIIYASQTEDSLRFSENTAVSVGGIGSGVLVSPTQILTAAHAVRALSEITVEFPGGETMRASVVASRASHDVALLELEGPAPVAPVELGDSDAVRVGDQIFVIGAPLGQVFTLTVGYVSARRISRDLVRGTSTLELIQTDAAINPGNSGGPMFSLEGEVVGIVSHILSESGGSQGLGFAVSVKAAQEALRKGRSFRFGLDGRNVTGRLAALLNVPPPGGGILVERSAAGSLAERLGLRSSAIPAKIGEVDILLGGDIILRIQGIAVGGELENMERILEILGSLPDGGSVFVTVLRDGEQMVLSAPLDR